LLGSGPVEVEVDADVDVVDVVAAGLEVATTGVTGLVPVVGVEVVTLPLPVVEAVVEEAALLLPADRLADPEELVTMIGVMVELGTI
jgi:hypothetical protein